MVYRQGSDRTLHFGVTMQKLPDVEQTRVATEVGKLLREWRGTRGKSQFDLSLDTGLSQRHISFIESGRSSPSRHAVARIARSLDIPLRDRNRLLVAAGFAPLYAEEPWDAAQMRGVRRALERMLRQHEPFPAIVMDRHWNVLLANESAPRFFNHFVDMAARPKPRNLLHLLFDPQGMRPFIANWSEVAAGLVERVAREAVGRVIDETTKCLLAELAAYGGVDSDREGREAQSAMPVIPVSFVKGELRLSYFSMVSTVGTPQTVAAQELRIESMFPADDATEIAHRELMKSLDNCPAVAV
jgi:transcriptional regulator with XRE-family HTH domain